MYLYAQCRYPHALKSAISSAVSISSVSLGCLSARGNKAVQACFAFCRSAFCESMADLVEQLPSEDLLLLVWGPYLSNLRAVSLV